jgi:hypothetical protein
MRKLHDIHSASSRARKNNNNNNNNNQQNNNNSNNNEASAYTHSSQSTSSSSIQLSPTPPHHIVNLNHHPFQQHPRISSSSDYPSSFMMPSSTRQRIDSTPFIAKVFWQKYYVNIQSQFNYQAELNVIENGGDSREGGSFLMM